MVFLLLLCELKDAYEKLFEHMYNRLFSTHWNAIKTHAAQRWKR